MMTNIDASIITIIKPPHRSAKCERSDEASTRKILTTLFRVTGIDLTTAAQCLHGMRAIFSPDLESAPASPGCEEATIAVTCQWQLSNLPPIQYFLSWLRHLKFYTSSHQSEFHLESCFSPNICILICKSTNFASRSLSQRKRWLLRLWPLNGTCAAANKLGLNQHKEGLPRDLGRRSLSR